MAQTVKLGTTIDGRITHTNLPYSTATATINITSDDSAEIVMPIYELPDDIRNNYKNFFVPGPNEKFILMEDSSLSNPIVFAGPIKKVEETNQTEVIRILATGIKGYLAGIPAIKKTDRQIIPFDNQIFRLQGTPAQVLNNLLNETLTNSDNDPYTFINSWRPAADNGKGSLLFDISVSELNSVSDVIDTISQSYDGVEIWAVPLYLNSSQIVWQFITGTTDVPNINKNVTPIEENLDNTADVSEFQATADGSDTYNWLFVQSNTVPKPDAKAPSIDLKSGSKKPTRATGLTSFYKQRFDSALTTAELQAQLDARLSDGEILSKTFNVTLANESLSYINALGVRVHFTGQNRLPNYDELVRITSVTIEFGKQEVKLVVQPAEKRVYPRVPNRIVDSIDKTVKDGIKGNDWKTPVTGKPSWEKPGTGGGGSDLPDFEPQDPFGDGVDPIFNKITSPTPFTADSSEYGNYHSFNQYKDYIYYLNYGGCVLKQEGGFPGADADSAPDIIIKRAKLNSDGTISDYVTMGTLKDSLYSSQRMEVPPFPTVFQGQWHSVFVTKNRIWVNFLEQRATLDAAGIHKVYSNNWLMTTSFEESTGAMNSDSWEVTTPIINSKFENQVFFGWGRNFVAYGDNLDKVALIEPFQYPKVANYGENAGDGKSTVTQIALTHSYVAFADSQWYYDGTLGIKSPNGKFSTTKQNYDTVAAVAGNSFIYLANKSYRGLDQIIKRTSFGNTESLGSWELVSQVNKPDNGGDSDNPIDKNELVLNITNVGDYIVQWYGVKKDSLSDPPEITQPYVIYNKIGFEGSIAELLQVPDSGQNFMVGNQYTFQRESPDIYADENGGAYDGHANYNGRPIKDGCILLHGAGTAGLFGNEKTVYFLLAQGENSVYQTFNLKDK